MKGNSGRIYEAIGQQQELCSQKVQTKLRRQRTVAFEGHAALEGEVDTLAETDGVILGPFPNESSAALRRLPKQKSPPMIAPMPLRKWPLQADCQDAFGHLHGNMTPAILAMPRKGKL